MFSFFLSPATKLLRQRRLPVLGSALLLGLAGCGQTGQRTETAATTKPAADTTRATTAPADTANWWKEAVVYQVYPRSYQDSNGDGVGDLRGLISRLDYIKSLGVNVIWLNPIYGSPNDDNGYDISDYRAIMKDFGTMADFDALLKGMHQRGLKVVLDLVVNHSSDEHAWFKQARSARTSPYRDYYHWWPAEKGWGTIYLGNHDQPRMVTRGGDDRPAFRAPSAKLLTTFLLTMRGTPYYYGGDELGMTNIRFDRIEDYRDIETRNMYKQLQGEGGDLKQFLAAQRISARDNGRTPFQWDATRNAGFTTGTPWLPINPNYTTINAAAEEQDPTSILHYFRRATALRRAHKVLVYGQYALLDAANPHIYAYTRTLGTEKVLVVLNFSSKQREWPLPADLTLNGEPWLNNYPTLTTGPVLNLQPWQAVVIKTQ